MAGLEIRPTFAAAMLFEHAAEDDLERFLSDLRVADVIKLRLRAIQALII